jgi:predicted  nucleic acid-binding Zn-ribbon protein
VRTYICRKADIAPVKPGPSSLVGKNIATSSSPVLLLWAHQLRREHSALLARVEGLATAVGNASSARLDEIAALVTKAGTKSSNIESEHAKLKRELDRAGENEKRLSDELTRISERVDFSEETTSALLSNFHTVEERLSKCMIDKLATVERKVQEGQKEQERQVQELKTQVRDIQNRLPDIVEEGVIGVRDSMEEIRQQMNRVGVLAPPLSTTIIRILIQSKLSASHALQSAGPTLTHFIHHASFNPPTNSQKICQH